jgi:hypothetical protein
LPEPTALSCVCAVKRIGLKPHLRAGSQEK